MKIPALLTALALACGTALAAPQYGSGSSDRDAAASRNQAAAVSSDTSSGSAKTGGFIEKTKEAFQRLGDKIRNATRKSTDRDDTNAKAKSDTSSMGAAGSSSQDSARQRRMDDAYANSKAKQQK
jgi:hypothetical protein